MLNAYIEKLVVGLGVRQAIITLASCSDWHVHSPHQYSNATMHMLTTLAYCTEGLQFGAFIILCMVIFMPSTHLYGTRIQLHAHGHLPSTTLYCMC